jgi:hypothetical protein
MAAKRPWRLTAVAAAVCAVLLGWRSLRSVGNQDQDNMPTSSARQKRQDASPTLLFSASNGACGRRGPWPVQLEAAAWASGRLRFASVCLADLAVRRGRLPLPFEARRAALNRS